MCSSTHTQIHTNTHKHTHMHACTQTRTGARWQDCPWPRSFSLYTWIRDTYVAESSITSGEGRWGANIIRLAYWRWSHQGGLSMLLGDTHTYPTKGVVLCDSDLVTLFVSFGAYILMSCSHVMIWNLGDWEGKLHQEPYIFNVSHSTPEVPGIYNACVC